MTLSIEERNVVVEHRLQRADETLVEAKDLVNLKHWHGAANRLYYACFYAVTALLIQNGHIAHTHGGAIGLFGKYFILTNIISREYNKLYQRLLDLRQDGDYSDWIDVDESDIKPLVAPAEQFIEKIKQVILISNK